MFNIAGRLLEKLRNRLPCCIIEIETDTYLSYKNRRRSKSYVKNSDKLKKLVKIHSAEAFLLRTFITKMSFDLN